METHKKIIVTSKKNLKAKYDTGFSTVEKLLDDLVAADKKRNIDTQVVYIDDAASTKKAGVKSVASITRQSAKKAIDDLYKKTLPAYLVIFGSQDIIPFQELINIIPNSNYNDSDSIIPSDLPYACDAPYSNNISSFTGPTRVVGRIPDITGQADLQYLETVIKSIIAWKPQKQEKFMNYFSVSASVWKKSTQQSLTYVFGNSAKLKNSPLASISYPAKDLKPLIHFYNCHGSSKDSKYYGQQGNNFPTAMESTDLKNKITFGTIVAAECCYGAELYDPANEDNRQLAIANTYFENKAIAFVGSSTIAYGPAEGQGLADLITQYFIKNVLSGASTGRAFLEARHQFLTESASLDPYEMKTLAQFYLLGDPSIHPISIEVTDSGEESVENHRLKLMNKGFNLAKTIGISEQVQVSSVKMGKTVSTQLSSIMKNTGFSGKEQEFLFTVKTKNGKSSASAKEITETDKVSFRTYIQNSKPSHSKLQLFDVLVLKESGDKLLGWKVYQSK
ncbi:MAG TPA: C25 family cysteine peptidase [Prolixibacteraceae bacterium]|nr:C25 family cysteine peptidase [Prolixibacteraceae bacterium]